MPLQLQTWHKSAQWLHQNYELHQKVVQLHQYRWMTVFIRRLCNYTSTGGWLSSSEGCATPPLPVDGVVQLHHYRWMAVFIRRLCNSTTTGGWLSSSEGCATSQHIRTSLRSSPLHTCSGGGIIRLHVVFSCLAGIFISYYVWKWRRTVTWTVGCRPVHR